MINTIIFDIGNVLAPFNWREVYEELFEGEVLEKISDITVRDTAMWVELDKGVMSHDEVVKNFVAKAPELEKEIRMGIDEIYNRIMPFDYSREWVKTLKENGYKVYALSNYGEKTFEKSTPRFPFLKYMDGMVISGQVKAVKPEAEIYNLLCEKYNIAPESAVFIDDNSNNIETAKKIGFKTILFTDKLSADNELKNLGIGSFPSKNP